MYKKVLKLDMNVHIENWIRKKFIILEILGGRWPLLISATHLHAIK